MARTNKFDPNTMFDDLSEEKKNIQDVQEVQDVQQVQHVKENQKIAKVSEKEPVQEEEKKMTLEEELASTRGKKGMKLPYIHVTCAQEVYDYLNLESKRRGISRNVLVNKIVQEYKNSPEGYATVK